MVRRGVDRCPGVIALHQAADGGLARVRVPGGVLSQHQLEVLSGAAAELGNGNLELTSRANLQLRGLPSGAEQELSDRLYQAGLLPSLTHERARNILASPLTGLAGHPDVLPLVRELDRRLQETPELAELPGRFLFALDDGTGDLLGQQADITVQLLPHGGGVLLLGDESTQVTDIPGSMLAAAQAFLVERDHDTTWRIADLPDGPARIFSRLGLPVSSPLPLTRASRLKAGPVHPGVLVAGVPLGCLEPEQVEVLLDADEVRVTPWRSVVVVGLEVERVVSAGLVVDAGSAWNDVTSCVGRPGCGKALADVRADVRLAVSRMTALDRPMHWSGCERRCGRPAGEYVDVLATRDGYLIDGERETR